MKTKCHCRRSHLSAKGRCFRLRSDDQTRLLAEAASAARVSAAQMTLDDWRELERELQQYLRHEYV